MTVITQQRFLTGLKVFDTYNGMDGTISSMDLNDTATNALSPMWVGPWFVVTFQDLSVQLFSTKGRRVIDSSGTLLDGVTLLTQAEKTALLSAGYPPVSS